MFLFHIIVFITKTKKHNKKQKAQSTKKSIITHLSVPDSIFFKRIQKALFLSTFAICLMMLGFLSCPSPEFPHSDLRVGGWKKRISLSRPMLNRTVGEYVLLEYMFCFRGDYRTNEMHPYPATVFQTICQDQVPKM